MKSIRYVLFCFFVSFIVVPRMCHAGAALDTDRASDLSCRLTDMDEFRKIFGPPIEEMAKVEGGMNLIGFRYENGLAVFGAYKEEAKPQYVLRRFFIDGRDVDIGCGSKMVLRGEKGLQELDMFSGFSGLSLKRVDLSGQSELLYRLPFDNETEWPDKLPQGCNKVIVY
ncbi:MAG: hypothetical protein JXA73_05805 [Acidobacteria bacterium]|nr:hypothetical protein [Acidobacteriota bacterium]